MEVAELIFLILSKQHVKHLSKFAFRILQKTFQIWNDNHLIFYSSSRAIMCYLVNKYGQNNPTTQQLYPQVRYKHPNLNILEILECLDLEHCKNAAVWPFLEDDHTRFPPPSVHS